MQTVYRHSRGNQIRAVRGYILEVPVEYPRHSRQVLREGARDFPQIYLRYFRMYLLHRPIFHVRMHPERGIPLTRQHYIRPDVFLIFIQDVVIRVEREPVECQNGRIREEMQPDGIAHLPYPHPEEHARTVASIGVPEEGLRVVLLQRSVHAEGKRRLLHVGVFPHISPIRDAYTVLFDTKSDGIDPESVSG